MTDTATTPTWRSEVPCSDRLSTASCEFLDTYKPLGRLSNTGIFWPFAPLPVICPFELVPLNVKKSIMEMPLNRSRFKTIHTFNTAMVRLFKYGYLPDINNALVERHNYWTEKRKKWNLSHPESLKATNDKRVDKRAAWFAEHQTSMALLYHTPTPKPVPMPESLVTDEKK